MKYKFYSKKMKKKTYHIANESKTISMTTMSKIPATRSNLVYRLVLFPAPEVPPAKFPDL